MSNFVDLMAGGYTGLRFATLFIGRKRRLVIEGNANKSEMLLKPQGPLIKGADLRLDQGVAQSIHGNGKDGRAMGNPFQQVVGLRPYTVAMTFRVVLEYDPETGSYSAVCPELPGCASAGDTEEEARANIREAIELYLTASDIELPENAKLVEMMVE